MRMRIAYRGPSAAASEFGSRLAYTFLASLLVLFTSFDTASAQVQGCRPSTGRICQGAGCAVSNPTDTLTYSNMDNSNVVISVTNNGPQSPCVLPFDVQTGDGVFQGATFNPNNTQSGNLENLTFPGPAQTVKYLVHANDIGNTVAIKIGPPTGSISCNAQNVKEDYSYSVTCEPTKATLTLVKEVTNNNGGTAVDTDFTLTFAGTSNGSGTEGQAPITNASVTPGNYTLTESGAVVAGYDLTAITCTGGADANGADGLTLVAGENVTCTFKNDDKAAVQGSLTLDKQSATSTFTAEGQVINYTYLVTNTGATTVSNLTVTDTKIPSVTCPIMTLAPAASTTCTGSYTITAGDMSTGSVTNEAVAQGTDPNGAVVSNKDSVTIKRDDDFIRDRTKEVIQNFLYRRADQLLSNEPDRNRLIRRLPGVLWGAGNSQTAQGGGTGSTFAASGGQGETTRIAFATSLSQLTADARAARQKKLGDQRMGLGAGDGGSLKDSPPLPTWNSGFDLWVEGHYTHFDDDQANADRSGRLGVMYGGVDYLVTPGLLVGALVEFDWMEDSSSTLNSSVDGHGWMAGPYMSARLSENIFFDARAAWGESDNNISPFGTYEDTFETKRWLVRGNLTGNWNFGDWRLTPSVSVARIEEDQQAYVDSLGISIPGQNLALGRVTFGPEIGYRYFASDGSIIEPHMALQGLWDFEKPDTLTLGNEVVGPDDFRGKLEAGVMFMMPEGASVRATGSYDGIGSDDFHAYGGQMWVNLPLH
jgi:uncharacterized repeat protein (TIGR01451 family)